MSRRLTLCGFTLLALLMSGSADLAIAQVERLPAPGRLINHATPWRSRLLEVDRLLRIGSYSRAASVLDEVAALGAPEAQVRRYRIDLYTATGDHEAVLELCRAGLLDKPTQPRLLRSQAVSQMALDRIPEARVSLNALFAASPNRVSSVADAMLLWRDAGHPEEGLALCDSLRDARGDPRIFMRQRAACLLDLSRVEESMAEIAMELKLSPMNMPMVREELWDLLVEPTAIASAIAALADEDTDVLRVVRADLLLLLGRNDEALAAVAPLYGNQRGVDTLLRYATNLSRELMVRDDPVLRTSATRWLIEVFMELVTGERVPRNRRARVANLLAGVCENALGLGYLDTDPERAADELIAALDLVKRYSPGSTRLYSAQIRLATHTRDNLGKPREAARQLERLLVDLALPLEGVALARLALGECLLAADDSARARVVLDRLGRNPQFSDAAGHAHYLLGRLDFAQGAWENARDRLAAVALDNARADYANDALDMGLLIAEELMNPTGGPSRLQTYASCIYYELARRPDDHRTALEDFMAKAVSDTPGDDPLLDRVRLELAGSYANEGRLVPAADLCGRVAREHPDGHRAAAALYRQGAYLIQAGREREGREVWERLLVQYPDALETDDTRERLRSLP